MYLFMEDFWSPLQKIIKELCLAYDTVWQTRKRVIDTLILPRFSGHPSLTINKHTQIQMAFCNQ